MNEEQFRSFTRLTAEQRNVEFKHPVPWKEDDFKTKVTRAVLAMSNIREGGYIVIGVEDQPVNFGGIVPQDAETYTQDNLADYFRNYADPVVKFQLHTITYEKKLFIVIEVAEFEETPVICKKEYKTKDRNKFILIRGAIYMRPQSKNESVPISSEQEMREVLDLATEKKLGKELDKLRRLGLIPSSTHPQQLDKDKFEQQLGELP